MLFAAPSEIEGGYPKAFIGMKTSAHWGSVQSKDAASPVNLWTTKG